MIDPEQAESVSDAEDQSIPALPKSTAHAPRRRRRIVISCGECHRRKQKCDRKLPCTNCRSRNRQSACRYEAGAPDLKARLTALTASSSSSSPHSNSSNHEQPSEPPPPLPPPPADNTKSVPVADFGYSDSASTLGVLHKIENAAGTSLVPCDMPSEESYEMRMRYKSLIRQLPARIYVDELVDIYLCEVNWQYLCIDEPLVKRLMQEWASLPFHVLSGSGPLALDPMLRALPSLLFQMMACALHYLPQGKEEHFESLKYTSDMTFDDLAMEFSEAGAAILTLLGKRQMSLSTVLAGWCRSSFLKFTGMVTESWHQLGTTIRDAQAIGLHRDQMDPQPRAEDSSEETIEKMWRAQHRRRVWLLLVVWDLHMGAVLGRPTSIDHRMINRSLPIDAIFPQQSAKRIPLASRTDDDPPTSLTRAIWAWQIMKTLRDIQELEKEGTFLKDFTSVEKIDAKIRDTQARTPAFFRLENENPDTRFDHLPECWWLPHARAQLYQLQAFNTLALHRPYVFTRAASRQAALQASLEMLESQRLQFSSLDTVQHRTYTLFYGTFDAAVMVASIYILFPKEHPPFLPQALQHFQWALERFEAMAECNTLARSALGVLQAIGLRFRKAVTAGQPCWTAKGETEAGRHWITAQPKGYAASRTTSSASKNHETSVFPPPADLDTPPSCSSRANHPSEEKNIMPEWSLPATVDFGMIMPMYPIGDVAYNDLTGGSDSSLAASGNAFGLGVSDLPMGQEQGPSSLSFGGEYGTDTIWNILNQFPP
ncbi:hypothetical protein GGR50DRAFT_357429 [Xylaria sp. CBS 124048]|nr:hypothetical protein GGR50DRAFT_357429 [Xylaria sp. CBS 124048]